MFGAAALHTGVKPLFSVPLASAVADAVKNTARAQDDAVDA